MCQGLGFLCFGELRAEQGGRFVSATDDESEASQPDYDVGVGSGVLSREKQTRPRF